VSALAFGGPFALAMSAFGPSRPFSRHYFSNRLLLPGGARATAIAFFADSIFTRRAEHGGFALPRPEFPELRESRDHEDQWKSAADNPDSNLDRERV
jgi:hypothetical protein